MSDQKIKPGRSLHMSDQKLKPDINAINIFTNQKESFKFISNPYTLDPGYYGLGCTINSDVVSFSYNFHQNLILNIIKTLILKSVKMCPSVLISQQISKLKPRQ